MVSDAHKAFDLAQAKAQETVDGATGVVEGPQLRILVCHQCKSAEELPDYQGDSNFDVTLQYLHRRHGAGTEAVHPTALLRCAEVVWADRGARKQILEGAFKGVAGFTPEYHHVKDTLKDDAVKCHIAHRRQIPCIDWHNSDKVLRAPTASERQKLADDLRGTQRNNIDLDRLAKGAPTQYLCDFCPVAMAVEYAKRKERGEV